MAKKCKEIRWIEEKNSEGGYKFKIVLSFFSADGQLAISDITKFFENNFNRLNKDLVDAIEDTMPEKIDVSFDSGKYVISLVDYNAWLERAKKIYYQRLSIWRRTINAFRNLFRLLFNFNESH